MTSSRDLGLLDAFRAKAKEMELKAIDFLDRQGTYPLSKRAYTAIRCTFIDGEVITLPRRLEKHFDKQVFKLRPAKNDS